MIGLFPLRLLSGVALAALIFSSQPLRAQAAATAEPQLNPAQATPSGGYLVALSAARKSDYRAAAQFMEQARKANPDDPELMRRALTWEMAAGNFDKAVALAKILVTVPNSQSILALTLAAMDELKRGELPAADARLATLPRQGVGSIASPLMRAWIAARLNGVVEAEKQLALIGDSPALAPLRELHQAMIRDMLSKDGKHSFYQPLLDANPQPPLRLVELAGNAMERAGEKAAAKTLYQEFIARNEDNELSDLLRNRSVDGPAPKPLITGAESGIAQAMFDVASLLQQDREGSELALLYVQLALMLQPDFPLAQMLLAEVIEAMNNPTTAITAYTALAKKPGYAWLARLRIAGLRDTTGDTAAALADLSAMSAENPRRFEALWRKADILRARERFTEAAEAYDAAIARVPTPDRRHWSLFFGRGIALERVKRWDRAESDMKRALQLQPEQPYVLNYLGYTWLEQNLNLPEAKAMIERAVALRPQDGAIVDSLGWAYYRLGEFETAAKHLERAVELKANDPTINDHLGDVYWRVGRKLEARFQWLRAMSLEPDADLKISLEKKLADQQNPPIATFSGKAP